MGKILLFLILAGLGWYAYSNGIWYVCQHGGQPEPGRACEMVGPIKEGVNLALEQDDAKYMYDAQIGRPDMKAASRYTLSQIINEGRIVTVPDHSNVVVGETQFLTLYGNKYPVVHVDVTSGDLNGTSGWVERNNVLDNPVMQLYQFMRGTSRPTKHP